MDKPQQERQKLHLELGGSSSRSSKPLVWDCGSSLYDSFELKSFERRLDSAIASRTMSMPHLSDHRRRTPIPQQQPPTHLLSPDKKPSKISRSLHKLLRSVFRPKQTTNNSSTLFNVKDHNSKDGFSVVYDKTSALTTIPELPETASDFVEVSPEIKSLVTRTASDRFVSTSIGVSCA